VWCLCWMGGIIIFSAQAEQTFRPPDCFIVTSCGVWGEHAHLSLRGCFQSRPRIWFYKCFSKNNHSITTCHSKRARGHFTVGAGRNCAKERMGCVKRAIIIKIDAVVTGLLIRYSLTVLVTFFFICFFIFFPPIVSSFLRPNHVQTTCCSHQLRGRCALRTRGPNDTSLTRTYQRDTHTSHNHITLCWKSRAINLAWK